MYGSKTRGLTKVINTLKLFLLSFQCEFRIQTTATFYKMPRSFLVKKRPQIPVKIKGKRMEKLNNDFQSGPHNLKGKYTLHELVILSKRLC